MQDAKDEMTKILIAAGSLLNVDGHKIREKSDPDLKYLEELIQNGKSNLILNTQVNPKMQIAMLRK